MAAPKFVQRIARLPHLLAEVAKHPDGIAIDELADQEKIKVEELREDLLAYYTADEFEGWTLGLGRPAVLEFLAPDGDDADPTTAEVVRVVDSRALGEIGVEHLAAHDLAFVYTAALALNDVEPDPDLEAAIDVLAETMFGEPTPAPRGGYQGDVVGTMREAIERRQRVDIVYSRQWHIGVRERTIDPYSLVHTRRGWEVDAGPPDERGKLRTFLVSNIRSADVSDGTFEEPPGLPERLIAQREVTTVRMQLAHDARWAADMYAENVVVVDEDDETFTADLELLQPVADRVGLITFAGGEDTRVLQPTSLLGAGPELAAQLHAHHRGE